MSDTVTSKFPVLKLKYAVSLNRARSSNADDGKLYIGLEQIESATGKLKNGLIKPVLSDEAIEPNIESMASLFEQGDVLFCKLRPYLAKCWVADFNGRCSQELLVMKPICIEARYLQKICLSRFFWGAVDSSTYGSKMPRADWDYIANLFIPVPSISKQRAIADFLDRETASIDELIAAKESLVELLAEKRKTLITRAVTKGIDPKAKLVDSGVEWIGEIPKQWDIQRLAFLFKERDERCQPELPLLEVSLNSGVTIREFFDDRIEGTASDFNTYKVARKDDIVFNRMRMWQGAVGIAPEDGLVSPDYAVAEPIGCLSSVYAGIFFRTPSFSAECARHSNGIVWDRLRLYWDGFREIYIPLPPIKEQLAIVAYIEAETAKIHTLSAAARKSIALLKERRAALIAEAVTGKIEIV